MPYVEFGEAEMRGSTASQRRWTARRPAPLLAVVTLFLAAACQEGQGAVSEPTSASAPQPAAEVRIEPERGTSDWRPDKPIEISASGGTLRRVNVRSADGHRVAGRFEDARSRWVSRWALRPGTRYRVTAEAASEGGETTTVRRSFRTLQPHDTFEASSVIEDGQRVGVGMPVIVEFDRPVRHKENVERAFEVRASERVEGAWHWLDDREVHFRPRRYWPAGTDVRLIAHLAGVRAAEDVYGADNLTVNFTVGDRHVTRIDTKRHTMVVKRDGKKVKTFPISAGKPSTPTTNGTHVAFQKSPTTVMDSSTIGIPPGSPGYYRLTTRWTVKFTYSGIYTHSMPSTTWAQGSRNVSHGCVNMSPAGAEWFYDFTQIGDIIEVTGTPRDLEWGNGWTAWEKSWKDWVAGSAVNRPIDPATGVVRSKAAAPHGSGVRYR